MWEKCFNLSLSLFSLACNSPIFPLADAVMSCACVPKTHVFGRVRSGQNVGHDSKMRMRELAPPASFPYPMTLCVSLATSLAQTGAPPSALCSTQCPAKLPGEHMVDLSCDCVCSAQLGQEVHFPLVRSVQTWSAQWDSKSKRNKW